MVQGHEKGVVPQRHLSICSRPKVLWALILWLQQEQQLNEWETQERSRRSTGAKCGATVEGQTQ